MYANESLIGEHRDRVFNILVGTGLQAEFP